MKYKLIRSMAHNWSHSFMSDTNYLDGGFIYEDIYQLAREKRGEKVVIHWIPAGADDTPGLSARTRQAADYYREALPKHLERHRLDAAALRIFRTEVYVADSLRMIVRAYVVDDRNREHVAYVWH